ncbi:hypothetical protein [Phaeacidiphilus oryzae]|uniref:hypothetical protein n=1 Tax=Phaeacidiphilus oryzae TaxID=348818 RepID=UPI000565C5E6|nr:hypothetical protein [Phaeacidiphilus oryzae]
MDPRTFHLPDSPARRKLEQERRQLLEALQRANQVYTLTCSQALITGVPDWGESEEADRLLAHVVEARTALREFDEQHPQVREPDDAPPPPESWPQPR